jgi:hypothetical protein
MNADGCYAAWPWASRRTPEAGGALSKPCRAAASTFLDFLNSEFFQQAISPTCPDTACPSI